MRVFTRGILGLAAAAGLAAAYGCGSDISEEDPPAGGTGGGTGATGGAGGGSGSGGFQAGPCVSTNPVCYGNREPSSVASGTECMAGVDNAPGGTLASRVQWRQTWNRVISPQGNTSSTVYGILKNRATIKESACFAGAGEGGYMQISDWDRSNPDPLMQTVTTGYASYSAASAAGAPPIPTLGQLATDGLCFIEWDYTFAGPATVTKEIPLGRWSMLKQPPLPQPWHVAPVTSKRVAADFDVAAIRDSVPATEGRIYIDEATGYVHGYSPFSYVTILDNAFGGIAIPIREVEIRSYFNDKNFNCVGRFRSEKMPTTRGCDPDTDQVNPQWGCKDDATCPPDPATMEAPPAELGGATGPAFTTGYFLIVDLERVWSNSLGATLCVTNPGQTNSEAAGWAKPTNQGGWGLNCRGSDKWNPDLPNDAGLPMGDWCAKENRPADENCHDAYRNKSYSTAQSFKVKPVTAPATLPATAQNRWTGSCNVATRP